MPMKTCLVAINSKYIHPNLAVRYLKANTTYPVEILEYTIKDNTNDIIDSILENDYDVLGFSVYIWNVEIIKNILLKIRQLKPSIKIILGGPEVSFVNDDFFDENLVDFIIANEGEQAFHQLLNALNHRLPIDDIPNLIYKDGKTIHKNQQSLIKNLNQLNEPYDIIDENDLAHKIHYVELSRGCPYQCSYCLASLEKGLRFFSMERVLKTIDDLVKRGVKTFKFLDRSFNANHRLAQSFLERLIDKHYQDVVFQFEINGDVLKASFIDFLIDQAPKNLIRFELGIQSTNDRVNQAVNRYQDTKQLIENIKGLQQSNVTLHLDLIAGLPYEDLSSFEQTFNTIYQLFADELQLGFLKVLKGTPLYYQAKTFNIQYQNHAPYEIIDSDFITKEELSIIHDVETMLNIYWNKHFMPKSIQYLTEDINAFKFFKDLAKFYRHQNFSTLRYNLNDIFEHLIAYLKANNQYNQTIASYLKYDFLNHHPIKPKIYWEKLDHKNDILRDFHKSHQDIPIDDLYKYALVTSYLNGYLIVIYRPNQKSIYIYEKD